MTKSQSRETLPYFLGSFHDHEEKLRAKALLLIERDECLQLLLNTVWQAMKLADYLRKFGSDDENQKVIRILSMRTFNAFAAIIKLILAGYGQKGTALMRDILETVFILGLFSYENTLIEKWISADEDKGIFWKYFTPSKVRKRLKKHVEDVGDKREDLYKLYSETAVHPSMKSEILMRSVPEELIEAGPFINSEILRVLLFELGRLGALTGEVLDRFCSDEWPGMKLIRAESRSIRQQWSKSFSEIITI